MKASISNDFFIHAESGGARNTSLDLRKPCVVLQFESKD